MKLDDWHARNIGRGLWLVAVTDRLLIMKQAGMSTRQLTNRVGLVVVLWAQESPPKPPLWQRLVARSARRVRALGGL
jgi:hypothetical protein